MESFETAGEPKEDWIWLNPEADANVILENLTTSHTNGEAETPRDNDTQC